MLSMAQQVIACYILDFHHLQVAMGARSMLRRNVCTADGVVNGVVGNVVLLGLSGHRVRGQQIPNLLA